MKKKIKIALIILITFGLVCGITYAIFKLTNINTKTMALNTKKLLSTNINTVTILDTMTIGTPHDFGSGHLNSNPNWTSTAINHFVWAMTDSLGRQIYCIEKGGSIRVALPSPTELKAILNSNPSGSMSDECAEGEEWDKSYSHWTCQEHITAMPDLAYILTEPITYGNDVDIEKYVLKNPTGNSDNTTSNEIKPSQQVINQTARYNRIHDLYEAYKEKYVQNGNVTFSDGTFNTYSGTVSNSDYYDVYAKLVGNNLYDQNAWEKWKELGWDRITNDSYYEPFEYMGITIPSEIAENYKDNFNAWRGYMIYHSSGYKEWKQWINGMTISLTYEQYYEYYRYIIEEKGGMDEFEVADENANYSVKRTEFNGNGEYNEWDMIEAFGYAKYEIKTTGSGNDFILFPNKTAEPNDRGPTEDAPQNDLANGVAGYYTNDLGTIMYKYYYGQNVGQDLKQYVIWLRYGKGDGISINDNGVAAVQSTGMYDMAKALLKEAEDYEEFGEAIDENANSGDESKENNLMGLTNQTDKRIVQVIAEKEDVNNDGEKETDYLTIGPLNIKYIEGIGSNGTHFGGISNMWVEGYNIYGENVKVNGSEKIEVEKFILDTDIADENVNGVEYKADYFTPNTTTKSFTDSSAQVYPRSGEWFYIKIKNPNSLIESDNVKDLVQSIDVKIEFKWMRATATVCKLKGGQDQIVYSSCYHEKHYDEEGNYTGYTCHYNKKIDAYRIASQYLIDSWGTRNLYKQVVSLFGENDKLDITMNLGGYVWEDTPTGKESATDGLRKVNENNTDKPLKNVVVTLYEYSKGNSKISTLIVDPKEENISEEERMHRVNSTLTDENGYYQFNGLDTSKKYYVVFEYNGQRYLPTDYLKVGDEQRNSISAMLPIYNTDSWYETSKALESVSVRNNYDTERFGEIRSYPENYHSTNNLGKTGEYNGAFTQIDLMGYTINSENGEYEQTGPQLIDGYKYDSKGIETTDFSEGIISTEIRNYIKDNGEYPNTIEKLMNVYEKIARDNAGDEKIWDKLQFIEDCKMKAYTASKESDNNLLNGTDLHMDLYPVYDEFVVQPILTEEDKEIVLSEYKPNADFVQIYDGWVERGSLTFIRIDDEIEQIVSTKYNGIYDGQFYVNCGLWRRQETDMALRKDIYKAALKINDKTVVYNYDKRDANNGDKEGTNSADGKDNNTYWDINVRMSDYDKYYNISYSEDGKAGYTREIYETDHLFDTGSGLGDGHPGDPLSVYITYKITVRNQSMSILTEIMEVVDYYDQDYEFKPNLSWVMYKDGDNSSTSVDKDQYYKMMEQDQDVINNESTSALQFITNGKDAKVTEGTSIYKGTEKELNNYQKLYINGLQGSENIPKKLASGESAYIYLTFEVKKSENKIILDEDSSPKENLAEINGYKTYYKDNTQLPNNITKSSNDIAGLIDRDSTPGNLEKKDLEGDKYEKNFEDDTDRAPSLRVKKDSDAVRKANGTVWEDRRTEKSGDAIIGDGIRQDEETKVSGVTVQLVEKCVDGTEYIWKETTTDKNGQYNFESYIPGDYVIRFKYGDSYRTALSTESKGNLGGENIVAYNGQDFKSTTYQDGIEQVDYTDVSHRYQGYKYTDTQNVTAKYNDKENKDKPTNNTFGYDIYASDEATEKGNNYSDAKDIWTAEGRTDIKGREEVMEYSSSNVTNHKAEVLASPYEVPTYNGTEYSNEEMKQLYDDLIKYTQMTAETGMIVVEFEYDRQQTDGLKGTENDENNSSGKYIGDNKKNSNYVLAHIDLGLTERPKAQLEIDKSVANVKVTLANGSILFDINKAANNALWQDHKEYSIDEEIKNGKYEEYYGESNKHRYSYRDEIDEIVEKADKGLIQLTMDEELMHGATIQITYTVKITNVGEVDYVDDATKDFYYKGNSSGLQESTTTANQVVDYVQNNLKFDENNEANNGSNKTDGWKLITVKDLTNHSNVDEDLVNKKLESGGNNNKLSKFNTIIQTESFGSSNLKPGDEVSKTLILSQLITPENTDDDMTYTNMVEIAKTSNSLGRRMAYSVVGNQDPSAQDASEVDSNVAERIVILPPFGEVRIYYILAGVVAMILIGGIILIRRKVLNGKDDKTE